MVHARGRHEIREAGSSRATSSCALASLRWSPVVGTKHIQLLDAAYSTPKQRSLAAISTGQRTPILEAWIDDELTGCAALTDGYHLDHVAVRPAFRMRGIARALVSGIASSHVGIVSTQVLSKDVAALTFLRSLGFVCTESKTTRFSSDEDFWHGRVDCEADFEALAVHLPNGVSPPGAPPTKFGGSRSCLLS